MLESALIQWVSTQWRRASTNSFHIRESDDEDVVHALERLVTSTPGAVLALLPHGKLEDVSRKLSATLRERLLEKQRAWPDLVVASSASLICLDAYPKLLAPQLYIQGTADENPALTDWEGYKSLLDSLITAVSGGHQIRNQVLGREEQICSIFYELFKNTHDHARLSLDNRVLRDSVRGIYARFYPVTSFKELTERSEEKERSQNILELYLAAVVKRHFRKPLGHGKSERLSGFLEISVFDSGPGLAAKWSTQEKQSTLDVAELTGQEQSAFVLKCFGKGFSSTNDGKRGFGLWKVLQQLEQIGGCIRVRTNKVHLFREFGTGLDLRTEQHAGWPALPEQVLFDWRKGVSTSASEYADIEGTLISMMLPLEGV
ncbi:MAG: hypothetical protein Q8K12_10825 [Thiobacillus sp.]|nr:hypothetical protein [Thiobacillus sp.]